MLSRICRWNRVSRKFSTKLVPIFVLEFVEENNSNVRKLERTVYGQLVWEVGFVANYCVETRAHNGPFPSRGATAICESSQPAGKSPIELWRILWSVIVLRVSKKRWGSIQRKGLGGFFQLVFPGSRYFRFTFPNINYCYGLDASSVKSYWSSQSILLIYLCCSFHTFQQIFRLFATLYIVPGTLVFS